MWCKMTNDEMVEFLTLCNTAANQLDRLEVWKGITVDRFRYLVGEVNKLPPPAVTTPGPGGWVAVQEAEGDWAWFKLHWPYPPDIQAWALARLAEEKELLQHFRGQRQHRIKVQSPGPTPHPDDAIPRDFGAMGLPREDGV
jgi:hypothetical protein